MRCGWGAAAMVRSEAVDQVCFEELGRVLRDAVCGACLDGRIHYEISAANGVPQTTMRRWLRRSPCTPESA